MRRLLIAIATVAAVGCSSGSTSKDKNAIAAPEQPAAEQFSPGCEEAIDVAGRMDDEAIANARSNEFPCDDGKGDQAACARVDKANKARDEQERKVHELCTPEEIEKIRFAPKS